MDPFSASASILTVLNAAGQSSIFLYKFFRSIYGASVEANQYCSLLEGLRLTFSALHTLQSEEVVCLALSNDFSSRLVSCSTDLRAVHAKIQNLGLRMRDSPMRKGWKRTKWSILSKDWLKKFFTRLQMYHIGFSLELNYAQLKLQASLQKLLSCKADGQIVPAFDEDLQEKAGSTIFVTAKPGPNIARGFSCGQPGLDSNSFHLETASMQLKTRSTQKKMTALPNNIQTPLQHGSFRNTYSSRTHKAYHCKGSTYSMILRLRPVYRKVWTPWDSTADWTQDRFFGRMYDINIELSLFSFRQLSLQLSILQDTGRMTFLSTRFNLSFPRIVPLDAPIMDLARNGDLFSMECLFRTHKAAPTDVMANGTTLLHIATSRDDLNMIRFLISRGASIDEIDGDGDTSLHIATSRGRNYEVIRMLIENGSELGTLNFAGRTPLHQHFNQVTRRILPVSDRPFELYTQDHDGMTIAHYLSWSKTTRPEELYHLIKDDVFCLAVKDNLGRSALHFAVMRGNKDLVSYILGLGISSNQSMTNPKGVTLFHHAAQSRRTDTFELVAPYCKDIFVKDHHGRSVLHYAAWQNNVAAVKKIVELGGAELLYQPAFNGETPLHFATRVGATSILAYADILGGEKKPQRILHSTTGGTLHIKKAGTTSPYFFQLLTRPNIAYRINRGVVVIFLLAIAMFLPYLKTPPAF